MGRLCRRLGDGRRCRLVPRCETGDVATHPLQLRRCQPVQRTSHFPRLSKVKRWRNRTCNHTVQNFHPLGLSVKTNLTNKREARERICGYRDITRRYIPTGVFEMAGELENRVNRYECRRGVCDCDSRPTRGRPETPPEDKRQGRRPPRVRAWRTWSCPVACETCHSP